MSMFRLCTAVGLAAVAAAAAAAEFDLQGHRGARGLAPENTMAGFQRALAVGVTTLETDLAVTKDGIVVIAHDPLLNPDLVRGPDGKWLAAKGPPIRTLTFAELQQFDIGRINPASAYAKQFPEQQAADGQRFPALADLLALGAGNAVRFAIETKITPTSGADTPDPATFARLALDVVRNMGALQRVSILSFDWRTLVEVKKLAPDVPTVCITIESQNFDTVQRQAAGGSPWHAGLRLSAHGGSLPKLVKAAGCGTWSVFWRNLTPELVAEARGLGLLVMTWTVNEPADMARLVGWGVDGIVTDYPDRLRKVLAEKGMPLPAGDGTQ